ncbi:hypothetical protein MJO28_010396 [Puccinia striiformis f. sp. tritici]|uniref:Uncharacterized protein n=1 Tax=Puccinia striiformis f. sp. tritici TaxID=168172 RepID=A0ACC0E5P0_9BASI|nr:hypothetical protein Pst134EA_019193 [Puccinia striiformis f. sp. tritici]KAH9459043.1 hypothetical protein Pst134EA_019193 [Puccinia striiformis f. sp. tritici]KAI7944701.1 hypothetical protein MJO28_010396 [Puccinia striiformis f. sp. tritici]
MVTIQSASIKRTTKETDIDLYLQLDCPIGVKQEITINTGIGFLDHMLDALAKHSGMSLRLSCHQALFGQNGEGLKGIRRFGTGFAPLDEALARAVVTISNRPYCSTDLKLKREMIGNLSCEMIPHIFYSFAMGAQITLHVDVLKGENDHHKSEASFKALALALKQAIEKTGSDEVPSTKGTLSV